MNRGRTKKLTLAPGSDQPNSTVWHLSAPISTDTSPSKSPSSKKTETQPNTPATITGREPSTSRTRALGEDLDPRNTEGKVSFFSLQKNKVIKKNDEDDREKWKKEKEKEKEKDFEFELKSASGGSSVGHSPQDGEDKWMG